ncbi:hypothetical protein NPIL_674611 [Nephila pilipes]|uniref:Uncharacterized protein n=1 Tax=Nephila pilipes TaxID=299642 RepID=A0A8X6UQ28_NEPPI|nr:hypothetical protein NPIL_674611 [Nephila pilipes]
MDQGNYLLWLCRSVHLLFHCESWVWTDCRSFAIRKPWACGILNLLVEFQHYKPGTSKPHRCSLEPPRPISRSRFKIGGMALLVVWEQAPGDCSSCCLLLH